AEPIPAGNSGRRNLLIAFIVLLLITNGVMFYLWQQERRGREVAEPQVTQLTAENQRIVTELDSLRGELEGRYSEIARLGGDTAGLRTSIRELDEQLSRARRQGNARTVELRQLESDYKLLLSQKDGEITKLRAQNEELYAENSDLKQNIVEIGDTVQRLSQRIREQAQKVAVASVLKAQNLNITYIDQRGKERDDRDNEFRGRRVDKVKVNFTIADNPVAKIETKDVMIRILEPEGSTLQDVATGSGTFKYDGQEIFYTAKQSFLFDNQNPRLTFIYNKGTPFKEGTHQVELYAEGARIGEGSFTIK
ncbi:MAG: chromosome segregation protein SMC, partial [Catalinimonas sp.]